MNNMSQTLKEVKEQYANQKVQQATLCFLLKENQILMALKKRGFATGKWNGSGGKVKPEDRNIESTAKREMFEETRVLPKKLKKVGVFNFYFLNKSEWNQQVTVFITRDWTSNPTETEEMAPKWFDITEIPYDKMWDSDIFWLPKILEGKIIEGYFLFSSDQKTLEHEVVEVA